MGKSVEVHTLIALANIVPTLNFADIFWGNVVGILSSSHIDLKHKPVASITLSVVSSFNDNMSSSKSLKWKCKVKYLLSCLMT